MSIKPRGAARSVPSLAAVLTILGWSWPALADSADFGDDPGLPTVDPATAWMIGVLLSFLVLVLRLWIGSRAHD